MRRAAWGLVMLVAALTASPAIAQQTAAYVVIFRCSASTQAATFKSHAIARTVPDSSSDLSVATAQQVLADATRRPAVEFEFVARAASYGGGDGVELCAPDGSGLVFSTEARPSDVRVALCALRDSLPTSAAGVGYVRAGEALLTRLTIQGKPCIGVMRVRRLDSKLGPQTINRMLDEARTQFFGDPGIPQEHPVVMTGGQPSPAAKKALERLNSQPQD